MPKNPGKYPSKEPKKRTVPVVYDEHGEQIRGTRVKGHKRGWVNPNPATPENQRRTNGPICGQNRSGKSTSGPGICCQPAGWGTDHTGYGACKLHGGSTPNGIIHAMKLQLLDNMPTLGFARTDLGPHEAILEEVQRTAGHVQWMEIMIRYLADGLEDENPDTSQSIGRDRTLHQYTPMGIAPSVWMSMYMQERQHLVTVCAAAVKMGCAERTVALAEEQGKLVAMVLQKIMHHPQLDLTPSQLQKFPSVAREALGTLPIRETTSREVTAAELPPALTRK